MSAAHTPTPWQYYWREDASFEAQADCGIFSEQREGMVFSVARCPRYQSKERWDADASLIVRAVNVHDDLVAALKPFADAHFYYSDSSKPDDTRTGIGGVTYGDFRRAVSALAKAEAQS